MKRILCLLFIFTLMFALLPTGVAAAKGKTETVDVIILAEGSTDGLVAHIQSLGGIVNFQYRNVNAVAASIPIDKMSAVSSFSGVIKIEKDRMVYLTDQPEVGDDPHFNSYVVEDMTGVNIEAISITSINTADLPEGYANFLYTGAPYVWDTGNAGEGTIVAVVDTGTVPNACIYQAVIGAPDFPQGYNATGDGYPATDPANHWHGTHVGGVIASACALSFDPTSNVYLAQATYLGWPPNSVFILGQAPGAKIYPVKVFPASGAGVPSSIILDGLDHILTLKKDNILDIDIVNMSLGGPTLWDGRDSYDLFMAELSDSGILVVTSAGNEGPTPNSVGSPGTSFDVLSVGALDYAPSSRVFYEYLGLAVWPGAPGMGLVMRPTDVYAWSTSQAVDHLAMDALDQR